MKTAFRHILCAVDKGGLSEAAILEAADLASGLGSPPVDALLFLHVLPDSYPGAPMTPAGVTDALITRERLSRQVGDVIAAQVNELTGLPPEAVRIEIEGGAPAQGIVERARAHGVDLVVVGARGAGDGPGVLGQSLLGSVAVSVVRDAPCSVLVARQPATGGRGGRVLLATDFSPAAEAAFEVARAEAGRRGTGLILLHSLDVARLGVGLGDPVAAIPVLVPGESSDALVHGAQEQLRARLAEAQIPGEVLVVEEPPVPAILRTAEAMDASLIVLGTVGKGGLPRLLLGSVAEAVVERAPCSVLVVRKPTPHAA